MEGSQSGEENSKGADFKTKKCSECLAEIPAAAKKCSHCGSKQKPKTSIGRVILTIVILFFVISWIASMGESAPSSTSSRQQVTTNTETAPKADQLELVSMNCYVEYDYFHVTGQVKNISGSSMDNVVAVGNAYTADGTFVKSDDALIDYTPILPGQVSPFEVLMTHNPSISKCTVEFKEFWGGTIPTTRSEG